MNSANKCTALLLGTYHLGNPGLDMHNINLTTSWHRNGKKKSKRSSIDLNYLNQPKLRWKNNIGIDWLCKVAFFRWYR
jgi:hypothetical protein